MRRNLASLQLDAGALARLEAVLALGRAGHAEALAEVTAFRRRRGAERAPLPAAARLDRYLPAPAGRADAAPHLDLASAAMLHEERQPVGVVHARLGLAAVEAETGLERARVLRVVEEVVRVRHHSRVAPGEPLASAHEA